MMPRRFFKIALVAITTPFALPPAQAQTVSPKRTIAYVHTTKDARDSYHPTFDIYSMSPDGTNVTQLTHDGNSSVPTWSPDGQQILFIQNGRTQRVNPYHQSHLPFGLYVMNRDGSDVRLLWSLKQEDIPFFFDFHVMNSEGANTQALLQSFRDNFLIDEAEWSPGGKQIAVAARGTIFLIPANGQGHPQLLASQGTQPSWSPDSKRIVFSQRGSIKTIGADGSGLADLTSWMSAIEPAWSPDGKQIAFAAASTVSAPRVGPYQIFLMNSDGSNKRLLSKDANWECMSPSFAPDGRALAVSCLSECPVIGLVLHPALACMQRTFVIPIDNPPPKLTPVNNEDAEAPSFAPN